MNRQSDVKSKLAWSERIEGRPTETLQIKRIRNSLLTIARIPPEILGHIFRFSVTTEASDPDFAGIRKDSYNFNFLLVCHRWYEVAHRTPELWSYWGNSLEDWKRASLHFGSSATDLVLDAGPERRPKFLDRAVWNTLRDRAARDFIRKVHLRGPDEMLLTSILSSLTPEGDITRNSSIESIVFNNANLSDFFARQHFSKLRNLSLHGCRDLPWDHLKSHTFALVNLSIVRSGVTSPPAIPTTSQILSVLSSNPRIRSLKLDWMASHDDSQGVSTPPVPLCHLEQLHLTGYFSHIFPILRRLELPEKVDNVILEFHDCKLVDIDKSVMRYIRDYLRRDARFDQRLAISLSSPIPSKLTLRVCVIDVDRLGPAQVPRKAYPYVKFGVSMRQKPSPEDLERICLDALTIIPEDIIFHFQTNLLAPSMVETITRMTNIEYLHLVNTTVRQDFPLLNPDGPGLSQGLPSLRWLYLEAVWAEGNYWGPLIAYLAERTSCGQPISLFLFGKGVHICPGPLDLLRESVVELVYKPDPNMRCPFGTCLVLHRHNK